MALKEIEIDDGLKVKASDDFMDDIETLEVMDRMASDPSAIIPFIKRVLGEEQYQAVKGYYVEKNGKMRISDLNAVIDKVAAGFPKA